MGVGAQGSECHRAGGRGNLVGGTESLEPKRAFRMEGCEGGPWPSGTSARTPPEASERCPHSRVALGGASPPSRAVVFSAPGKGTFPKAQLRRMEHFFPSTLWAFSPPHPWPLLWILLHTVPCPWDGTQCPFEVWQYSRQERPMPVPAATPGQRDMGPVPRLPTTLTLTQVGLPGTEGLVCIRGSPEG